MKSFYRLRCFYPLGKTCSVCKAFWAQNLSHGLAVACIRHVTKSQCYGQAVADQAGWLNSYEDSYNGFAQTVLFFSTA
jgi:hypothetical protein